MRSKSATESSSGAHHDDAGVVHQHVEPTEPGDRLRDRGLHRGGVGAVRPQRERLAARRLDRPLHLLRLLRRARIRDRDVRALARETLRDCGADPARCTGDQGDLALERLAHSYRSDPGDSLRRPPNV
jgi:hypothetical protein